MVGLSWQSGIRNGSKAMTRTRRDRTQQNKTLLHGTGQSIVRHSTILHNVLPRDTRPIKSRSDTWPHSARHTIAKQSPIHRRTRRDGTSLHTTKHCPLRHNAQLHETGHLRVRHTADHSKTLWYRTWQSNPTPPRFQDRGGIRRQWKHRIKD